MNIAESIFWKPLHRLLTEGAPASAVTFLCYDFGDERKLPFAAICKTRGNRLILWTPASSDEPATASDGDQFKIHHATLELASGQTHLTHFWRLGDREHRSRRWKLSPPDHGVQLWLIACAKISFLAGQLGECHATVPLPLTDSARRLREFTKYVKESLLLPVKAPPARGDYVLSVIGLGAPHTVDETTVMIPFPMGDFWGKCVAGWPADGGFDVITTKVIIEDTPLAVQTACPPGRIRCDYAIGGFKDVAQQG